MGSCSIRDCNISRSNLILNLAEKKLSPLDSLGNPLKGSARLKVNGETDSNQLRLQEAILVGNFQNQIKFSELTLDIYRVLQSLEREPSIPGAAEPRHTDISASSVALNTNSNSNHKEDVKRQNARKYLLYRPTFATLMVNIATCFKDINDGNALLLYISADGSKQKSDSQHYSGI